MIKKCLWIIYGLMVMISTIDSAMDSKTILSSLDTIINHDSVELTMLASIQQLYQTKMLTQQIISEASCWKLIHLNYVKIVGYLIERGCSFTIVNDMKRTPLHWAAINNREQMIRALLSSEIDVHAVDNQRHTPLYYALTRGCYESSGCYESICSIINNDKFNIDQECGLYNIVDTIGNQQKEAKKIINILVRKGLILTDANKKNLELLYGTDYMSTLDNSSKFRKAVKLVDNLNSFALAGYSVSSGLALKWVSIASASKSNQSTKNTAVIVPIPMMDQSIHTGSIWPNHSIKNNSGRGVDLHSRYKSFLKMSCLVVVGTVLWYQYQLLHQAQEELLLEPAENSKTEATIDNQTLIDSLYNDESISIQG